jgi:hypothetical protein
MKRLRHSVLALLIAGALAPMATLPVRAQAVVRVSEPPPPLPEYDQPPLPDDGYLWIPGYWAYDTEDGYFWVPGTWVQPPRPGLLWTPGYWDFENGLYGFHPGYWAEEVGFYGGVDYGNGYDGEGYHGGYWRGDAFYYNRAATRFGDVRVRDVYEETIVRNPRAGRISFNGGPGGIVIRPTARQIDIMRRPHIGRTVVQERVFDAARRDPSFRARENKGRPARPAVERPDDLRPARDARPADARPANARPAGAEPRRDERIAPAGPRDDTPRIGGGPADNRRPDRQEQGPGPNAPRDLDRDRPQERDRSDTRQGRDRPDRDRQDRDRQGGERQGGDRPDRHRQDSDRQDRDRPNREHRDRDRSPDAPRAAPNAGQPRPQARPSQEQPQQRVVPQRPSGPPQRLDNAGPRPGGPHNEGPRPGAPHPGAGPGQGPGAGQGPHGGPHPGRDDPR